METVVAYNVYCVFNINGSDSVQSMLCTLCVQSMLCTQSVQSMVCTQSVQSSLILATAKIPTA